MLQLVLLLALLFLSLFTVNAQETTLPAFATVENDQLVLYDAEGNRSEIVSAANGFRDPIWSPDGSRVAFLMFNAEFSPQLGIVEVATATHFLLDAPLLDSTFNPSWTSDGRLLYVAQNQDEESPDPMALMADMMVIEPAPDAQPEKLGSFGLGIGCGGGSTLPADWIYWEETNGLGGFFLPLVETDFGIVHSTDCGGEKLALFDPASGTSTVLVEKFAKAVVSPDRTRVVGLELNYDDRSLSRTLIYDLATAEIRDLGLDVEPDQVRWSADGNSLYYSVQIYDRNLTDDLTDEQKNQLSTDLGYEMFEVPGNRVEIYQISVDGGASTLIYNAPAYAIGRIIDTASGLYITQIPNMDGWLQALTDGTLSYNEDWELFEGYVQPEVLWIPSGETEATFLGNFGLFTPAP
ncbi:MAG: hypothetical protein MUF87_14070 [Anaerolineae bacterium]|jgi:hypothetical protein|nr:hypothetical protein [Anaerolineae bacterium]